jgi:16S rRNA (guanine527-N7)-methyltransferase
LLLLERYFPEMTQQQRERFAALQELYGEWNAKINVVSRKDVENLYERHVLHSLGIAKVIGFVAGTRVIDVGTGGGFPGIPLAILFPDSQFHLIDSIGKKIKVVEGVAEALGLKNVSAQQIRAEELKRRCDFVVSRAVTRLQEFYQHTRHLIEPGGQNALRNGILYLKGGDLEEELAEFKRLATVFSLSDHFQEEFFATKKVVYVGF